MVNSVLASRRTLVFANSFRVRDSHWRFLPRALPWAEICERLRRCSLVVVSQIYQCPFFGRALRFSEKSLLNWVNWLEGGARYRYRKNSDEKSRLPKG